MTSYIHDDCDGTASRILAAVADCPEHDDRAIQCGVCHIYRSNVEWARTVGPAPAKRAARSRAPRRPLLPVLSWDDSQAQYGCMYPGDHGVTRDGVEFDSRKTAAKYLREHRHHHDTCGHNDICGFSLLGQPCQAYEVHEGRCYDCQFGA